MIELMMVEGTALTFLGFLISDFFSQSKEKAIFAMQKLAGISSAAASVSVFFVSLGMTIHHWLKERNF